ncbi:30S ribosomal protein S6e [Candidatus Bathyarchaeota archaeon]|nr:30S ribosomal protein S6e [Candidatus Bathyarchaeota archaeon]
MAKMKLSVSSPDGKAQNLEVEGDRAQTLLGKRVGETIDGTALGLQGTKLEITGGSDKDGFPMRRDVHGGVRPRILIGKGIGFKSAKKGERRRKLVRGNTITEDIVQVNLRVQRVNDPKTKPQQEPGN